MLPSPVPLVALIQRQAPQERDRHLWVSGEFQQADGVRRQVAQSDAGGRERVTANDVRPTPLDHHQRSSDVTSCVLPRLLVQIPVERLHTAAEGLLVLPIERLDPEKAFVSGQATLPLHVCPVALERPFHAF